MKAIDNRDETKAEVETERKNKIPSEQEMAAFDAAVARWRGFATERMLELGFKTTDEFMKAVRGR